MSPSTEAGSSLWGGAGCRLNPGAAFPARPGPGESTATAAEPQWGKDKTPLPPRHPASAISSSSSLPPARPVPVPASGHLLPPPRPAAGPSPVSPPSPASPAVLGQARSATHPAVRSCWTLSSRSRSVSSIVPALPGCGGQRRDGGEGRGGA